MNPILIENKYEKSVGGFKLGYNVVQCRSKVSLTSFCYNFDLFVCKGLFTWREEDPSTRKILERRTPFRFVYMQKIRPTWLPSGEGKEE